MVTCLAHGDSVGEKGERGVRRKGWTQGVGGGQVSKTSRGRGKSEYFVFASRLDCVHRLQSRLSFSSHVSVIHTDSRNCELTLNERAIRGG